MSGKLLIFLAVMILATTIALLQSYREFRALSEVVTLILGISGSILGIIEFFRKK